MKLAGLREASLQVGAQSSMALVYELTPPRRGRFEFGAGSSAISFALESGLV